MNEGRPHDPYIIMGRQRTGWIDAAITAFLAAAREDGLKLVAREASEEMSDACETFLAYGSMPPDFIWEKMFDAAPDLAAPEVKP